MNSDVIEQLIRILFLLEGFALGWMMSAVLKTKKSIRDIEDQLTDHKNAIATYHSDHHWMGLFEEYVRKGRTPILENDSEDPVNWTKEDREELSDFLQTVIEDDSLGEKQQEKPNPVGPATHELDNTPSFPGEGLPIRPEFVVAFNNWDSRMDAYREVMSFGKHKGKLLKDIPDSYVSWLKRHHVLNQHLEEQFIKLGKIK